MIMNKEILIVLFLVFSSLFVSAEETGTRKHLGMTRSMSPVHVSDNLVMKAYPRRLIKEGNFKVDHLQRLSSHKSVRSMNQIEYPIQKSQSENLSLQGLFYCKGISYWGGIVQGKTQIEPDTVHPGKLWISNLVPEASTHKVYAQLASDGKTLSIPQGQNIYVNGSSIGVLTLYGSSADIKGKFDPATGVITILSDLWGVNSTNGWFELFTGPVTYTHANMMPPSPTYHQPQGALFMGLVPQNWDSHYSSCIVGAPNSSWTWANAHIEEGVDYSWSSTDSITGETITSDRENLTMEVKTSYYGSPALTAINNKGISNTFILGIDYKNKGYDSYCIAGGNGSLLGFNSYCDYGVANLDNGFTLLSPKQGAYYFGTGASAFSESDYETLLVKYDKPLSTLYFEGIDVYLFAFSAPDNTPFTIDIFVAREDSSGRLIKGDFIATKSILAQDVVPIMEGSELVGYTMKFDGFKLKDEEGFIIKQGYIEMNESFLLELSGFNTPGVALGVCTEEINPPGGLCRSYHTVPGNDTLFHWNTLRQTMYFNLQGAAYAYIEVDTDSVYDAGNGGTYTIEAIPFFDTLYVATENLPDWLHVLVTDQVYNEEEWNSTVKITVDALKNQDSSRHFELKLESIGAQQNIVINQGGSVGTSKNKALQKIKISKEESGFQVSYPAGMKSLSVYTAAGAMLATYPLNDTGVLFLPRMGFPRGLCLLRFDHHHGSELIKVVN